MVILAREAVLRLGPQEHPAASAQPAASFAAPNSSGR
jgi:hypothetical protein